MEFVEKIRTIFDKYEPNKSNIPKKNEDIISMWNYQLDYQMKNYLNDKIMMTHLLGIVTEFLSFGWEYLNLENNDEIYLLHIMEFLVHTYDDGHVYNIIDTYITVIYELIKNDLKEEVYREWSYTKREILERIYTKISEYFVKRYSDKKYFDPPNYFHGVVNFLTCIHINVEPDIITGTHKNKDIIYKILEPLLPIFDIVEMNLFYRKIVSEKVKKFVLLMKNNEIDLKEKIILMDNL